MRNCMAVMFTDIAGFTSLMEKNEAAALKAVSSFSSTLSPLLEKHSGKLVKEMGDGTLTTFSRPRSAISCARDLQQSLSDKDFKVRIGMHWGGVHLRENDVFGDTVNVASRLESLAPPGGICISEELLNNCGPGRKPASRSLGLQKLKGLGRLVHLFYLKGSSRHRLPVNGGGLTAFSSPAAGMEHPSLAVLPFENLGEPGDEFYAHGINADLVTSLAAAGGLAVAPLSDVTRLSSVVSDREVMADRLNVRFTVSGSLWKQNDKFRLSMDLYDNGMQKLIWTDSWTDSWAELPAITGKLADTLLKVLGSSSTGAGNPVSDGAEGSEAYRLFLLGSELYRARKDISDTAEARNALETALELQPRFVRARLLLGTTFIDSGDYDRADRELETASRHACEKGDRTGNLLTMNWIGVSQLSRSRFREARNTFVRTRLLARALNDLSCEARALSNTGLAECNLGRYAIALDCMEKALNVPGVDSMGNLKANTLCNIGLTHWRMGETSFARDYFLRSLELFEKLENLDGQANLCMNLGIVSRGLGSFNESIKYTEKALELNRRLGNRRGECRSLVGMGNGSRFTGDLEKANAFYKEALKLAEEIDDTYTLSVLKSNLGSVLYEQGRYSDSLKLFQTAVDISASIGDEEGRAETMILVGKALGDTGKITEAIRTLRESITVLEEIGATSRAAYPKAALARMLISSGKLEKAYEEALAALEILTGESDDRTETLFILHGVLKELAGSSVTGRSRALSSKARSLLKDAYSALLHQAGEIEDSDLRSSFMSKKINRRIREEYELSTGSRASSSV